MGSWANYLQDLHWGVHAFDHASHAPQLRSCNYYMYVLQLLEHVYNLRPTKMYCYFQKYRQWIPTVDNKSPRDIQLASMHVYANSAQDNSCSYSTVRGYRESTRVIPCRGAVDRRGQQNARSWAVPKKSKHAEASFLTDSLFYESLRCLNTRQI